MFGVPASRLSFRKLERTMEAVGLRVQGWCSFRFRDTGLGPGHKKNRV